MHFKIEQKIIDAFGDTNAQKVIKFFKDSGLDYEVEKLFDNEENELRENEENLQRKIGYLCAEYEESEAELQEEIDSLNELNKKLLKEVEELKGAKK